jgi:hypothetical protein
LLADFGEVSTLGLASLESALILNVPAISPLAKARLQKGDAILTVNGTKVPDAATLLRNDPTLLRNDPPLLRNDPPLLPGQALHFTFSPQQRELTVTLTP